MSLITENPRITDFLLYEEGESINLVRDAIVLASGGSAVVAGQVLGQSTLGAATSAAKAGGNTGNGTLVLDATTPIIANADKSGSGVYTVRCTIAGANAATFIVLDPRGVSLGTCSFNGSGASVTFADRLKFVITDGGTDFVVGDGFDITVAVGSGQWAQVNPAAFDGTQNAAAVAIAAGNPAAAAVTIPAIVRGPAILKTNGLTWTAGMTNNQKTAALAQLAALGITNRGDYGV